MKSGVQVGVVSLAVKSKESECCEVHQGLGSAF